MSGRDDEYSVADVQKWFRELRADLYALLPEDCLLKYRNALDVGMLVPLSAVPLRRGWVSVERQSVPQDLKGRQDLDFGQDLRFAAERFFRGDAMTGGADSGIAERKTQSGATVHDCAAILFRD